MNQSISQVLAVPGINHPSENMHSLDFVADHWLSSMFLCWNITTIVLVLLYLYSIVLLPNVKGVQNMANKLKE